jgi:hypothetical protein
LRGQFGDHGGIPLPERSAEMRSELENLRVCGFRDRLNNTGKYSAFRVGCTFADPCARLLPVTHARAWEAPGRARRRGRPGELWRSAPAG